MKLNYKIDDAKTFFFDRAGVDDLHKDAKRGLIRFGALVRVTAKRSMRRARQLKLAEMTKEQRRKYYIKSGIAKSQGEPRPKRPLAPSEPGEPPRRRVGYISKFLFFAYEQSERSVVVGPAQLDAPTGAPEVLEEGGYVETRQGSVRISQRPYMKPAFDKHIDKLPRMIS